MKRLNYRAIMMLGACTFFSSSGWSQARAPLSNGDGIDTHLFRPAVDSKGFFTVNGSETLGAKNLSFGLVLDYGHQLMRLPTTQGNDNSLIRHSFQGTFQVNYGLFHRLLLGLQLPVNLMYGENVTGIGPAGALYDSGALNAQSIPFVAAHAKLKLLGNTDIVGVSLVAQAGIPLGNAARDLSGDPSFWYWPQLVIDRQFGPPTAGMFRVGLNVGYRGNTSDKTTRFDQLSSGRFESSSGKGTGGLAVSYRVFDDLDLVAETYGTRQVNSSSTASTALSAEAVGGIKVFVEKNSYLMLGAGARYTHGFEAADQRAFLGFIFEPSIGDRDGDGIKDDEDKCPDEPEDFDGFEDKDGCPDLDNDKDGIPDSDDRCPNQAETRNGYKDEDGCPDVDPRDRDGDGIPDVDDACPDVRGAANSDPRKNGCPPDRDGDGIPDTEDACPDEAGIKSSDPKKNGCPPDRDGDGIPDAEDACPDEAGVRSDDPKKNGCPAKSKVVIEENNILILEKVQFATGSAEILAESNELLDAVATALRNHPEFHLIEIQGHADARGNNDLNLRLTKDRATSVVNAITRRGIDASRLRPMGYGKYCPLDAGKTEAAYEKNRRVEFKIVVNKGESTNVELGCAEARKHGVASPPR